MKVLLEKDTPLKFVTMLCMAALAWFISLDIHSYFYMRVGMLLAFTIIALSISQSLIKNYYLYICTLLTTAIFASFVAMNIREQITDEKPVISYSSEKCIEDTRIGKLCDQK